MKATWIGCALTSALALSSAPAHAGGHYNIQVWDYETNTCDTVASGQPCLIVVLEASTSTWCGSSCSSGEINDTFNKAITELENVWLSSYKGLGFREMNPPKCYSSSCATSYDPPTVYADDRSVWPISNYSAGSRNDYLSEIVREQIIKP